MKPTIPYIDKFVTEAGIDADALFDAIAATPAVRERNKRNKTSLIRHTMYGTWSPIGYERGGYRNPQPFADLPDLYKPLLAAVSEYAKLPLNYVSVPAYETELDYMNFHTHQEDYKRADQTVYCVSLGEIRTLALRPGHIEKIGRVEKFIPDADKSKYEYITPAHGSLYVLPSHYNRDHQHAIPDAELPCGLRICVNFKYIPVPTGPQVRWGNKEEFPDAVYVGKANSRGKFDYPASPFGNVKKLKPGPYREYVLDLVKEPCYAQELEKLWGRDLLCPWCKSNEKDCHARVLLELANA